MKKYVFVLALTLLSGSVFAVNINQGGYGEAVLLPYYTVNNGLNTLISVSNSTDQVKAVKINFREGKEGMNVLAFNLFLAPHDIWVAGLASSTSSLAGHEGEESTVLLTNDTTCAPFLPQIQTFLPYEIDEGEDTDLSRSREGYVEILEMGVLDPSYGLGLASTLQYGVPVDCESVEKAYEEGGMWSSDGGDLSEQILPVTGGLSASASVIDVTEGALFAMESIAFENFYPADSQFHASPHDTEMPSLADADTTSVLINNGEVIQSEWENGYQAVSAVLMKSQLESLFDVSPLVAGKTEMVLSFPTKRFYQKDEAPFTLSDVSPETGCVTYEKSVFNRDSEQQCNEVYGCSFKTYKLSPIPPETDYQLCYGVNTLQWLFNQTSQIDSPTEILGSRSFAGRDFIIDSEAGKLVIDFSQSVTSSNSHDYMGLPVISMGFQKYTNSAAAAGLLAQYAGVNNTFYKSVIETD